MKNIYDFFQPLWRKIMLVIVLAVLTFVGFSETIMNKTTWFNSNSSKAASVLNVKDYGAKGDGVTDDYNAIQTAMNSVMAGKANDGKAVYFPAGNYRVSSYLYLQSGMKLEGEGSSSILSTVNSGKILYAWNGGNNISVRNLAFKGKFIQGSDSSSDGIAMQGVTNGVFQNLSFDGFHYGIAIGSGQTSSNLIVDNITATRTYEPIYMANVASSLFSNLNLQAEYYATNQWHGIYICHDVNDSTFKNISIKGGSGYSLQLWTDEGSINRLTFDNVNLDATTGRYPLVIGHDVNDINMTNMTFVGKPSGNISTWYGGSNVTIDGFTASGGSDLVSVDGTVSNILFKNGVYTSANKIDPANASEVTFENVTVGSIPSTIPTSTTTLPSTTTSTVTTKPTTTTSVSTISSTVSTTITTVTSATRPTTTYRTTSTTTKPYVTTTTKKPWWKIWQRPARTTTTTVTTLPFRYATTTTKPVSWYHYVWFWNWF